MLGDRNLGCRTEVRFIIISIIVVVVVDEGKFYICIYNHAHLYSGFYIVNYTNTVNPLYLLAS